MRRSVNAIVDHAPLARFISEDHTLSRERFVLERGPEKDALIAAIGRAGQFAGESRANELSRQDPPERSTPAFHGTGKLGSGDRRLETCGLRFIRLRIIASVHKLKPLQGRGPRFFLSRTLFRQNFRDGMYRAPLKENETEAGEKNEGTLHALDGLTSLP
jgi:hypothetical protein